MLLAASEVVLIDDSLYFDFLSEKLSHERIANILASNKKWKWVQYVFLPCYTLIKCSFISSILYIGGFFLKSRPGFGNLFGCATIAEFVFFVPVLIKVIWFGIFQRNYGLEDLNFFAPLSVLSLFNHEQIDPLLVYPFQLLNLFEISYWVVLAQQVGVLIDKDMPSSLGFVARTYGLGLLLWVIFMMFLTVSLT